MVFRFIAHDCNGSVSAIGKYYFYSNKILRAVGQKDLSENVLLMRTAFDYGSHWEEGYVIPYEENHRTLLEIPAKNE